MTCREFQQSAGTLTLRELSHLRDEPALSHARSCGPCGEWLQRQRTVAASMQALQARTAAVEAGPEIELAVLRAFREAQPGAAGSGVLTTGPSAKSKQRTAAFWEAAPSAPPVALRLSQFFEVGAYAAVAAALIIGTFLGVRLLQHESARQPANQTASVAAPAVHSPNLSATGKDELQSSAAVTQQRRTGGTRGRSQPIGDSERARLTEARLRTSDDSQTTADTEYVALMFCDPLSCGSDSQVVRMELPPSPNAASAQPQVADVVVGYDGMVRAVRIVN